MPLPHADLPLSRDITRKVVNAAFAFCMSDGGMARDTSIALLREAFAEANAFAELLGRDGMRFCRRCERPVDQSGNAHPLGSSGQICAAYGHVFDETEPSPSPWANTGKLIDAAERAGKVGSFQDLVVLCLDENTDTSFYAVSEGDRVFCFSDDDICTIFEQIEKSETRARDLEVNMEVGALASDLLGMPPNAVGNLVRDRRQQIARAERAEKQLAFLRKVIDAPDPAPCRNCARVVLAGPACCDKPDIPPYETPIAALLARAEAAEERATKLASELAMEKARSGVIERDLERISRGDDDEDLVAHESAEIGALRVELATAKADLAKAKELLALGHEQVGVEVARPLFVISRRYVTCSGNVGADGRCQECGQAVSNSAGSHLKEA